MNNHVTEPLCKYIHNWKSKLKSRVYYNHMYTYMHFHVTNNTESYHSLYKINYTHLGHEQGKHAHTGPQRERYPGYHQHDAVHVDGQDTGIYLELLQL